MDLDKSKELCRILKTGKQGSQNYELPDELTKLSEAELLEFLKNNEKEIINGVIDTFSECGIKITVNGHVVTIESPGHYKITYDVETGKQIKAETQTKLKPKAEPGFGSSAPRFPANKSRFPTTKSRVTGGTKFTGRNITKKNRANLTHLKKNIRGMVMNGGDGIVTNCIRYICLCICVVALPPLLIIDWTYKAIYMYIANYAIKPIYTAVKMNKLEELYGILAELPDENKELLNKTFIDEEEDRPGRYELFKPLRHRTLLFVAVQNNNTEIVKALIDAGANVNTESYPAYVNTITGHYSGRTPLFIAVENNNTEIMKALVKEGANVNATAISGRTPLFDAVSYGNIEMVNALVKEGADVNATYDYGKTPLFEAINYGNIEMVNALLTHGADVYARPLNVSYTPILYAKSRAAQQNNQLQQEHWEKIVKLLETYGQRNTTLLLMDPKEGVGVLQDLKVAHDLNASTIEDFYDYLGPDPSRSLRNAKREKILEKKREEGKQKLRNMSHKEREEEEEEAKKRREILSKRVKKDDDDGTPGGKNSRSKTRKQKRRKTKK